MEPAIVVLELDEIPDVDGLLELANTPTAGPRITATIEENRVVFVCPTWRPILEARLEDAIAKLSA